MKKWFNSTALPIFMITIALFMFFIFTTNRNEFDIINRLYLSIFYLGFIFLILGISQFLESRGKMRISCILIIVVSIILLIAGLIILPLIDSERGFFDILMMLGLPVVCIIVNFVKLKGIGKKLLITKNQFKMIEIMLTLVIVVSFVLISFWAFL